MADYDDVEGAKLGLAEKQASDSFGAIVYFDKIELAYKERVRLFSKWNKELASELLETGKGLQKQTSTPAETKSQSPSPKQRYCPKCKDIIPITWKNHGKSKNGNTCGWIEGYR